MRQQVTVGCEATPLPESAFCISDGSRSTARRRILLLVMALPRAGLRQVASPFLPLASSGLLLLDFSALYLAAAAHALAATASSQCSSFVQLVFVQRCSWKCLRQLCHVRGGVSLAQPLLLCSPGSIPVPWFSYTHLSSICSLPAARPPDGDALGQLWAMSSPTWNHRASGYPGIKQTLQSTSATAREEWEHCCHLLCCITSFSQIRSGRSKEMANSARVCLFFVMEGTSQARKTIPSLWLHSLLVAFRAESENSSLYIQSLLIQF